MSRAKGRGAGLTGEQSGTVDPKLSICIPTYNRSRYLGSALSDLFRQQAFDFDFEVLISDNNSADDTQLLVSKFARQHRQIRYVRQSRNVVIEDNVVTALRLARGQYVVYL